MCIYIQTNKERNYRFDLAFLQEQQNISYFHYLIRPIDDNYINNRSDLVLLSEKLNMFSINYNLNVWP
jgi:hypothetical protein